MKLFQLTNIKTGKVIPRKMTQADIDQLRACKLDSSNPNSSMLNLYTVEEFEVPTGDTFKPTFPKPPYIKEGLSTGAAAVKKVTKGPAAAGQTTHADQSN